MGNKEVLCIILGGGAGTRLQPLTTQRSKPAVPIGGKYRLIDIPISNCINSGLMRMFVLTQFNSASLNRHIKNTFQFGNFSDGFVDILAAEQTPTNQGWFQGTADAVRQSMHRLDDYEYEYVLILSGDQLYQMDYSHMIEQHKKTNAALSIATIPVTDKDAPGFGIMKVDGNNNINSFYEKPSLDLLPNWRSEVPEEYAKEEKYYLASMGIYLFDKEVLRQLFIDHSEEHDFGKAIIPAAMKSDYTVKSFSFGGYWTDIGTIRSFFEANLSLCDNNPHFSFFNTVHPVFTRSRMLSPSKLFGTKCTGALIADGCIIYASEISRSIVGIRSRIGKETTLKNTIVMGKDSYQDMRSLLKQDIVPKGIGRRCNIQNAIIDINARIADDVTIIGDESLENEQNDLYWIVDGIVIIRKGAVIAAGSTIGKSF